MGKGKGWLGIHVTLFAIFVSLCKRIKPVLVIHEGTPRFPFKVFEELLPAYKDYHSILQCEVFGVPVKRTRAYDCLVHEHFQLVKGIDTLHHFASKCTVDASIWLHHQRRRWFSVVSFPTSLILWSSWTWTIDLKDYLYL